MDAGIFEWVISGLVAIIGFVGAAVVSRLFSKIDKLEERMGAVERDMARHEKWQENQNGSLRRIEDGQKELNRKVSESFRRTFDLLEGRKK